ncbi:PAS domain-containing protein [Bradyrhizobium sp. JR7.2]
MALARDEGRFETEVWRVRKDGGQYPIRTGPANSSVYAKITRDLNERRRSAETLAESEERFRLLVEGIADEAIYMLDPKGHISS